MLEPETAGRFFRERFPAVVAATFVAEPPELMQGSFVDQRLAGHLTDLLYKVKLVGGDEAYIYTLVDHKSSPDPAAPLQLGRYLMQVWDRLSRETGWHPLTPILPILVYHGVKPWKISTKFSGLFGDPPEVFKPYLPEFEYHLVDLSLIADDELSSDRRLRAFLTVMKHIQRPDFVQHMDTVLAELRWLKPVDVIGVLRYVIAKWHSISQAEIDGLMQRLELQGKEEIMAGMYQVLTEEGYKRGLSEGEADVLVRFLVRRFGPLPEGLKERIGKADADMIDRWFDQAAEAASLDDVFKDT